MYESHKGEVPKDMLVCHVCDNPNCINPNHLFLGTNAENARDKVEKNRQIKGEKCNHKLTEQEAKEIKYKFKNISQRKIAEKYNISQQEVSKIKMGKSWKHI